MASEDSRKWILIVDDDSSVRTMLARVLSDEGYGVLTAANGADALSLAETLTLNLVLLDLNMPGMSGWDVIKRFGALASTPRVIIITATPNQKARAQAAGVEMVLEKPLDFPRLLETVNEIILRPTQANTKHE